MNGTRGLKDRVISRRCDGLVGGDVVVREGERVSFPDVAIDARQRLIDPVAISACHGAPLDNIVALVVIEVTRDGEGRACTRLDGAFVGFLQSRDDVADIEAVLARVAVGVVSNTANSRRRDTKSKINGL